MKIEFNENDIIKTAYEAAINSYGVVSISNKNRDVSTSQDTKKGKMEEGIFVKRKSDDTFAIDIYLVLAQEIKITEALRECAKVIKFRLEKKYPKMCREVNVYAVDLSSN